MYRPFFGVWAPNVQVSAAAAHDHTRRRRLQTVLGSLSEFPDMLRRPFPSPLHRYKVWICRRRLSRSPQLDEIFHDQLVPTKEPNPFSVWQLVLDALTVIERCEPEVVRCEPRRDGVHRGIETDVTNGRRHTKGEEPGGL